jgi:hypothetical protein
MFLSHRSVREVAYSKGRRPTLMSRGIVLKAWCCGSFNLAATSTATPKSGMGANVELALACVKSNFMTSDSFSGNCTLGLIWSITRGVELTYRPQCPANPGHSILAHGWFDMRSRTEEKF